MNFLSYSKAILDYKLATHHEDKIKNNSEKLTRIKVYIPSPDLCKRIEAVETVSTRGTCSKAVKTLERLVTDLETYGNIKVVKKIVNNRYKLAGVLCVKMEYHFPDGVVIKFPADPSLIIKHEGEVEDFIALYNEILSAYSVSNKYVKNIRARVSVLKDEF